MSNPNWETRQVPQRQRNGQLVTRWHATRQPASTRLNPIVCQLTKDNRISTQTYDDVNGYGGIIRRFSPQLPPTAPYFSEFSHPIPSCFIGRSVIYWGRTA
ncbi:MAG: hypothetical protein R3C01_08885 [Planctomycetaceae bacterium]